MRKKKSHEEFLREVTDLFDNEFSILDKYTDSKTKIKIKHSECNYEWFTLPHNLLRNGKCPNCSNKKKSENKSFSTEEFKSILRDLSGDEYSLLGEYKNANTKIKLVHNKCGNEWLLKPSSFVNQKARCPKCQKKNAAKNRRKTHKEFLKEVYDLVEDEYIIKGLYSTAKEKVEIKHSVCGYCYQVSPDKFLGGSRCPKCSNQESKGEKTVDKWLSNNGINYQRQYKFDDCKNIKSLPFDFAVFDKDEELKILIEYDGEQHFKPIEKFGGKEGFERTVYNDSIKNNYCKKLNIKLLRIPYWDINNIEEILSQSFII